MNEHHYRLMALTLAAILAVVAAYLKTSEPMLYALSGAIISGEYALSRSGSAKDRDLQRPPEGKP